MSALLISIAALALGPLVHQLLHRHPSALAALEGFILVAIGGLVLLHVIPDAVAQGGWLCLLPAALGMVGPTLMERLLQRSAHGVHTLALVLALAGLLLHATLDGTALAVAQAERVQGHPSSGVSLTLAVLLHRIPVGLTIWWLLRRPGRSPLPAIATLVAISAATLVGYGPGALVLSRAPGLGLGLFQGLVGGTLLHVVLHQPHRGHDEAAHDHATHGHAHQHRRWWTELSWPALLGAAVGAALLLGLQLFHAH